MCTSYFRHQGLASPPTRNGFTLKCLPSLRNGTPIRSILAFGFVVKGCPQTEIELEKNHLPSFGNMAPSRSKSACGFVANKVHCQKLRLTGTTPRVFET
ncbi:uncharacterized protein LACBIDRAFT_317600 [Laccaria bicolor S238N-H82]|uniref:Predicted protein n=1 Tax=Laccaria bicolor (strain S238N-H82 / ATCC MYA-4686) TaxID=486041 RepID=B0D5B4_LACBS|nr:uncharacterized protein LACBIDRAFT_317819 [Laccaria bicolor S238N-H82]XP_001890219.1 uncharacterized protein LACBIDRAFT_317600 [Laccaria bicolor S238N-H82]EDQ99086.1 predicted protein [Laccaria bicolor S238N-H82]EDR09986.1 predicted protein [Laccaria bicolor S238N-H82]|eukprot:XP_001879371.1 predicted protein [Laccaria bicolor S238N-H82]